MHHSREPSWRENNEHEGKRNNQAQGSLVRNIKSEGFLEKAASLFLDRGVQNRCDLNVRRDGNWYVLQGRVDSYRTKRKLLKLVPEVDGNQWIVDKLEVRGRRRRNR